MEKITQTEQDYINFKLLISESKEGMSFLQQDNDTASKFLGYLSSESFDKTCEHFFKLDDDKIDRVELILLRWLEEIKGDNTRIDALKKEVEQFPIYNQ